MNARIFEDDRTMRWSREEIFVTERFGAAIVFHGPTDAELTQGTFAFRHPHPETTMFFIVPGARSNAERIPSFSRFEAEC